MKLRLKAKIANTNPILEFFKSKNYVIFGGNHSKENDWCIAPKYSEDKEEIMGEFGSYFELQGDQLELSESWFQEDNKESLMINCLKTLINELIVEINGGGES